MRVSRATILAFALLGGCSRQSHKTDARTDRAALATDAASSERATRVRPVEASPADALAEALAAAYLDTPFPSAELEHALARAAEAQDPVVARAWLYAVARRAPTSQLARVIDGVTPSDREAMARALDARDRSAGPATYPAALLPQSASGWTPPLATLVQRFRLPVEPPPPALALLLQGSFDAQLTGARLFGSPTVPPPDAGVIEVVSPFAIPPLARSLSGRPVPPELWQALLRRTAHGTHLAPRQWANAWRAVRDAASTHPELAADVAAAIAEASGAEGLPARTASWLRCENAVVLDRAQGWPDASVRCAAPGFESLSLAAQAKVLGAGVGEPGRRATALLELLGRAQGQPRVLEAICEAATQLPVAAARPLIRRLGVERDGGVLAAFLDALTSHLQHVRAMTPEQRESLLRAPFELPEAAGLEARLNAVRLAATLHLDDPSRNAPVRTPTLRAVDLARQPDAANVTPLRVAAPANAMPVRLVIDTDAGRFTVELDPTHAPLAVARIAESARAGRYDGLIFHRVVPGFVVQGGDPRGDGYGGTDQPVRTELGLDPFDRGAVGVPLAGLDTGGMQFFVVLADAPHLDGRYPWIGRVSAGMDVLDGILEGDEIHRVSIESIERRVVSQNERPSRTPAL